MIKQINDNKESGGVQPYQQNRVYDTDGILSALPAQMSSGTHAIQIKSNTNIEGNIRRLTVIECERLQGFPDNWTKYGIYERQVWINKKEKTFRIVEGVEQISRTQRYKLCGNAVTRDIVELIGTKLLSS